jgi:hypothetical protein
MDWMLIIVAVSLAASFVLSASETALTSLGKLEAQTLLARGDAGGRLIHAWVRDPHRILITVLVGNNIANTAASSLIAIWIKPFTSVQITVGMAIFAFVLIVGCEIVPKLLARSYATQLAVPAIRLLLFVNFLLKPIIWVTQRITDAIVTDIVENQPDFICLNYANADMVGHTGVFSAAIKAVETVDRCMNKLINTALDYDYDCIIIADHGNSDYMINEDGTPNTAHTKNPVPIIYASAQAAGATVKDGKLGDIAPTILKLMGVPTPAEMTGTVLIER